MTKRGETFSRLKRCRVFFQPCQCRGHSVFIAQIVQANHGNRVILKSSRLMFVYPRHDNGRYRNRPKQQRPCFLPGRGPYRAFLWSRPFCIQKRRSTRHARQRCRSLPLGSHDLSRPHSKPMQTSISSSRGQGVCSQSFQPRPAFPLKNGWLSVQWFNTHFANGILLPDFLFVIVILPCLQL